MESQGTLSQNITENEITGQPSNLGQELGHAHLIVLDTLDPVDVYCRSSRTQTVGSSSGRLEVESHLAGKNFDPEFGHGVSHRYPSSRAQPVLAEADGPVAENYKRQQSAGNLKYSFLRGPLLGLYH